MYLQVQKWLFDINLPATNWGWKMKETFEPLKMHKPPAPETLLNIIFCNCKMGCEKGCTCRKSGLFYSSVCGYCQIQNCTNIMVPEIEEQNEELQE